jgi:hypothetical protein
MIWAGGCRARAGEHTHKRRTWFLFLEILHRLPRNGKLGGRLLQGDGTLGKRGDLLIQLIPEVRQFVDVEGVERNSFVVGHFYVTLQLGNTLETMQAFDFVK